MNAAQLISLLNLTPLPREGGFFRETYRATENIPATALPVHYRSSRAQSTCIFYLLTSETRSALHRLPTDEIFHFYLGDAVQMLQLRSDGTSAVLRLGRDIANGDHVQLVVPKGVWQGAMLEPGGQYALMGTTMAPGFEFDDYESADMDTLMVEHAEHAEMIRKIMRNT